MSGNKTPWYQRIFLGLIDVVLFVVMLFMFIRKWIWPGKKP